ncbi:hypothetical protein [Desmospora activa]|uniref:Uncharacterized protein n=1 Tax=Desmospora activa DSM 45169 TaxID=1121389 RepID=A0A2T4Z7J2_9BACL|nr:hypothetical protein [Desmospora activa]PTM57857.1 hypothetical protein C8J48_0422 [Desmospora activa DSM 45169]
MKENHFQVYKNTGQISFNTGIGTQNVTQHVHKGKQDDWDRLYQCLIELKKPIAESHELPKEEKEELLEFLNTMEEPIRKKEAKPGLLRKINKELKEAQGFLAAGSLLREWIEPVRDIISKLLE